MQQQIAYPRDLVTRLASTIIALHSDDPYRESIPTEDQLECMLDVAWSATMIEEEGRRGAFTLGFVSEAEATGTSCKLLAFDEPTECCSPIIAKLALATDPRETIVGVQWSSDREPEIWGLLQLGSRLSDAESGGSPRFLHVTGFRPGCLLIESHGRRLVLYMNGVAHWYERGADNITTLLRDTLHITASALGSSGNALAHEFEKLAERLVLAGHGGALLVAGSGGEDLYSSKPRGVHLPPSATFRSPNTCLRDAFLERERDSQAARSNVATQGGQPRSGLERDHLSALDHVARLSNVDGAVVMGPDLCVYGFGATIDLSDDTRIPPIYLFDLTVPHGPPRSVTVAEFHGHRHKSAVHFCAMQMAQNEDRMALAIIASQDGTLSLFGLVGKTIAVYRPFILRSVSLR